MNIVYSLEFVRNWKEIYIITQICMGFFLMSESFSRIEGEKKVFIEKLLQFEI